MLLARDGKLSLDDQVRKYIPELPDYPLRPGSAHRLRTAHAPLTIRHMLNHTSGLRDWGSVAAIAGWPRGSRAYTHAHVLEIVSRQHALNFPPGTRWSYSNTGFNLAAIIVERVSGMSFQEFTRTRLFQPLGMTHTSWRDDYTRIVKGRAQAYDERDGAFHIDMPFENVYGNGGLLTTVGDLLKWNEHYDAPPAADAAMIAEQQTPGHFNDGRAHGYGLGLFVGTYKGLHEVFHSGSTGGYSAFLTRFPEQRVSVAVLCNAAGAPATRVRARGGGSLSRRSAEAVRGEGDAHAHCGRDGSLRRPVDRAKPACRSRSTTTRTACGSGARHRCSRSHRWRLTSAGHDEWQLDAYGIRHTDPFGTIEELAQREAVGRRRAADPALYAGDLRQR